MPNTAEHLEQFCQRLKHGTDDPHTAQRDFARRSVQLYAHSGEIHVTLPAEAFALVEQVLLAAVEALPEDLTRTREQAQADALVVLLTEGPAASAAEAEVLIHVDAEALSGEGGASDLPIPVVKRLCCDGAVVPIYKDGAQILNVGRKQRTVPLALKRALAARDRTCRFPGCHHRHYLHAHHIQHWSDGGETALHNLILLCSHHHKLVHEGGFQLTASGDQFYFARPDGRPIEVGCPSSAEDG